MNKFIITNYNCINIGIFFEDGKASEIHGYEESSLIGNIYIGVVSNIVESINAAFVDIMPDKSCYLSLEDYTGDRLKIGNLLLVQVVKDEIKTKRATVTADISLTGEYFVVKSGSSVGVSGRIKEASRRNNLKELVSDYLKSEYSYDGIITIGGIIRTKAENEDDSVIINEVKELSSQLKFIIDSSQYRTAYYCMYKNHSAYIDDIVTKTRNPEITVETDNIKIFNECKNSGIDISLYEDEYPFNAKYSIDSIMKKALSERVYLKSGGYLVIQPTEAMIVIDVNSGKSVKGKTSNALKINIEAAYEIGRQLKLRNMSGIIIVDFVSMKEHENNKILLSVMNEIVFKDIISCKVIDMTPLGLVEITRKKQRKPLWEIV